MRHPASGAILMTLLPAGQPVPVRISEPATMWTFLRSITLTRWILISMGTGILIGWLAPEAGAALKPLSTIFLRLIKAIIVPLLFGTLVIGIAGHGDDLKRVGRLAW